MRNLTDRIPLDFWSVELRCAMVATYDRHEISFVYPENWELSEEYQSADTHCVTLQSPGSGFWMLQAVRTSKSPELLAAEALRSVKQEFGDVEVVRVEEELEGTPAGGVRPAVLLPRLHRQLPKSAVSPSKAARTCCSGRPKTQNSMRSAPCFPPLPLSLLNQAKRSKAMSNDE